jgi:hypothetical protein
MSIFESEEVVAPTQEAAIAEIISTPVVEVPVASVPAAPIASSNECTRDTRGDAPCAVKDCENCN